MKKYGLSEFEGLQTSTMTVMVYSNVALNRKKIFPNLPLNIPENVPRTKKKKTIDKKNLRAPYGSVVFVDNGTSFRGLNLRKRRARYCPVCQPVKETGQRQRKVNTVHEFYVPVPPDIFEVRYRCSNCQKIFKREELGKTPTYFLNQITIVLSVGDVMLNVMMFTDNFKIAGCKKKDNAIQATKILWEKLSQIPGAFSPKNKEEDSTRFLFSLVMRNVDFRLGFPIDRQKLNQLMNSEKYSDRVCMSQCEPTGNTNVNIKMYSKKPESFTYDCLVIPRSGGSPRFDRLKKNPYKKKKKSKHVTLIVFSSSEVILSGRYEKIMKEVYEFFVQEAFLNRELIEEKIEPPSEGLLSHLKKTEKRPFDFGKGQDESKKSLS